MTSVEDAIRAAYPEVIASKDMNEVTDRLRGIAQEAGLGVALLVAWRHGLEIKYIPQTKRDAGGSPSEQGACVISADGECPYTYVHVPVRLFRNDKAELERRGIMNPNADPAWFIYHEDGLVGTFSFHEPASVGLSEADIKDILHALAQQDILVRANINNRQVQFKDQAAKRRIEESGEEIYVRVENRELSRCNARLPGKHNRSENVWEYIQRQLLRRSACNYCSVQALTPRQATLHSADAFSQAVLERYDPDSHDLATVRNYQLGFTYSPFGDPRKVCHFLAWDFPHINDLVINMEPQVYSFSDLIRLVRVINQDIQSFCTGAAEPFLISGACNHFAGNSIYHQHYQFFHIPDLPLLSAVADAQPFVIHNGVEVARIDKSWPSAAFLIRSRDRSQDAAVMAIADRVAREWRLLNEGKDDRYGNRIAIDNHTQNIFVTIDGEGLVAIFIPRDRRRLNALHVLGEKKKFAKNNAAVMEMMGYFMIDDPEEFKAIDEMPASDRKALGDSWLTQLCPEKDIVQELEDNVRISLSDETWPHEEQLDKILAGAQRSAVGEISKLAANVRHDGSLKEPQRIHLYRELLSAVLGSDIG